MKSVYELLDKLDRSKEIKPGQFKAICPGHHDTEPSLSIKVSNGKVLLKCFGGCELEDILKPINLESKDLFLREYIEYMLNLL